ncbi:MAG TPA: phosphoadenylyl-sulfate reductase [Balneolaceae bacterium]|nr:phosphoadenylyl-sulfate reductase [Balneolaceae bacterium]|tara:strand:+ start:48871 stop:49530 length:660 start_codon:yes stop_codon:yes gene_type:complete
MESLTLRTFNKALSSAHIDARIAHILNKYGSNVLVTTSFGTTSVMLLHMISRIKPGFPIHFVDTGFLFPETHAYKDELIRRFGLNVITHKAPYETNQRCSNSRLWETNPDKCCTLNKVEPLQRIMPKYNIWVSGLMGYQSEYRTELEIIQEKKGIFRFYPLIDWTKEQVDDYIDGFGLPRHPLEGMGFSSVGCTHCTVQGDSREGRWSGQNKSECGLHV